MRSLIFICIGAFALSTASVSANPERACVIITTANGTGTGFILKRNDNFFLVTNQHVIDGPPPHKYEKFDGSVLEPLTGWIAPDRDIAIFHLKNKQEHYLELETDIHSVGLNEDLIIYGNSLGQGMRISEAKLIARSLREIEVSGGIVEGNSGGPIIRKKTGKVLAASTFVRIQTGSPKTAREIWQSDALPKVRYYGVRIDTIENPDELDLRRFVSDSVQLEADNMQKKRAEIFLILLIRFLGYELYPDEIMIIRNADRGHRNVFDQLKPSGLHHGEYNKWIVERFINAGVDFFRLKSKPSAYTHKIQYRDLHAEQKMYYEFFLELVREIPMR